VHRPTLRTDLVADKYAQMGETPSSPFGRYSLQIGSLPTMMW